MDDPLQDNGTLIKNNDDDIEVMIMLETTKQVVGVENDQAKDTNDDGNTQVATIQDNNENKVIKQECLAIENQKANDTFPNERINIRVRCNPSKPKNDSDDKQRNTCHEKYFSSSRLTKTESCGKSRSILTKTSCRSLTHRKSNTPQECKYGSIKPENDDCTCSLEENWKMNDSATSVNDRCDRLYKDMEKLKKSVAELIKVKTENSYLIRQIAFITKEKASLLSLLGTKEDSMRNFENLMNKLKCESRFMLEEKENKIQMLMSENLELAEKVKKLDKTITEMNEKAELREKSYAKELAKRTVMNVVSMSEMIVYMIKSRYASIPTEEEFEEQKSIWEKRLKECICKITEKDGRIQEIEEKFEELKVINGKAEEESLRCVSIERELTNSNIALEGKLSETEKSRKELQEKLALLEKEKEEKESELRDSVKELEERIEELADVNKKLEESLKLQAGDTEEKKRMESNEEDDDAAEIDALKQKLTETRKSLEQDKIELEKRDKIILEFEETIIKIKEEATERIEELERKIIEMERTEINMKTSFCRERFHNEILLSELSSHRCREKQLALQLNETLQQLSEYESGNAGKEEVYAEHSLQLQQIENEIEKKTAEWYTYLSQLSQERDAAISTARAAKEELTVYLDEFQKKFAVQRRIQQTLTGMLHQKEHDLKVALATIVETGCFHPVEDSNTSFETEY